MYRLADPDTRGQMDDQAKWVNTLFIAAGALVGLGTGLYSYQLTMHCEPWSKPDFTVGSDANRCCLKQMSSKLRLKMTRRSPVLKKDQVTTKEKVETRI